MKIATPVRERGTPDPAGYRLLRDVGSRYADGAEADVLAIIERCSDLSSSSEELITQASGWAQNYHLDPTRANIVRALDLPPGARVLEIGAGCGAVTRYLGERCAAVDAVEPVPVRAAAASARCRDLDTVQVFVGEIDDVPPEPAYDVVVVIGVLEYVGAGSDDRTPYLDFLGKIAQRLVAGGTLALAIENRLGVKYLAGSPEDHTNRAFDSLEGYPRGGPARTFSRVELEALFADSGLTPSTLVAFPDYKMTRAVFGHVPAPARSLLYRVPRLPSPDWRAKRSKGVSEGALWRTLVDAGLELEFGNSFLVLGGKQSPATLWPTERAGIFYSTLRRAHLVMQTEIVSRDDRTHLRRTRVAGHDDAAAAWVIESDVPFQPGTDLAEVLAARGVEATAPLLAEWLRLLDTALAAESAGVLDLVPHNLVLDDDGQLHPIDLELTGFPVDRTRVITRGVFYLAVAAAGLAPPSRWPDCDTIGELMVTLGRHVGLPADGSWLEEAIADEAVLQAAVRSGPPAGTSGAGWTATLATELRNTAKRPLRSLPLGERINDTLAHQTAQLKRVREDLATARAEVKHLRAEVSKADAALQRSRRALNTLRTSPEVRLSKRGRAVARRLLPAGTRRRRLARRVATKLLSR